ncbi:MAG: penicillin-insensitive murein endopeptidase [Enterobacter hormaechei]
MLAAEDNDVTRIFVNLTIKQQLCLDGNGSTGCVKCAHGSSTGAYACCLRCPANSLECEDQPLPPPGDGCGYELQSWFEPAKPGTSKPRRRHRLRCRLPARRYWMSMYFNG